LIFVRLTRPTFVVKFGVEDDKLDQLLDLCNKHFGDPEWDRQMELAKKWWPSRNKGARSRG
jgi:hypothetical protein